MSDAAEANVSNHAKQGHQLKIWLGCVKLDCVFPSPQALQQLLYGSADNSAEDADVVALFLIDLLLTNETVDAYRHMLQRALRHSEDYIVNESDRNLLIRYIPAQLVKLSESGGRYVSMSVAVHRRNTLLAAAGQLQQKLGEETFSVFPAPVMLTCKSPRKNVQEPSFKGVLAQFVSLRRENRELDLLLLGANLDTQSESRLAQLEALERFLELRRRGGPFSALMWGDFNSRLVAYEDLRPVMDAEASGKLHLQDAGVDALSKMLACASQRRALLQKDDLLFAGRDVFGRQCTPSRSAEKLRELFSLHIDASHLTVPLPSYKRTPVDHQLSELLGCRLRLEDLVVASQLDLRGKRLEHIMSDLEERYFGWQCEGEYLQREVKRDAADDGATESFYLQLGWPDGVGIYKGSTVPARLLAWETDDTVLAKDHLPLRSVVTVDWAGHAPLKVWLGFAKLDFKAPTRAALQQLLYGSPASSAADADVVALFLTDLLLTNDNVDSMRHMLQQALQSPHEYVVNEQDPGLPVRNIPAQLVKSGERGGRYVSMSVAIHRRNVEVSAAEGGRSPSAGSDVDCSDCFLLPVQLSCKSPRKNELEPSFKAVLLQEVLLSRGGERLDLVLLGANLDTQDEPRLAQMEAVHRILKARKTSDTCCAIIWGDLNHRLVAYEELLPHVRQVRPGDYELSDSGARLLAAKLETLEGRLELLRKDAMVFVGRDIEGRQCEASRSSVLMRRMFSLHIDAAIEGRIEVPLPFYKHTPPDFLLSQRLGFRLRLEDVALTTHLRAATLEWGLSSLQGHYFGWHVNGRSLQRVVKPDASAGEDDKATHLQLGWLDGIGIYKGGTALAELLAWETEDQVLAFDHLPLRALVGVSL